MIKKLSSLLRSSGRDPLMRKRGADSEGVDLISRALIGTFTRCPICDAEFVNHYFTLLGVIPASNVDGVTDLVNKVKAHEWQQAGEVREFDPTQDAVEVLVLRCPGKRLGVVIMNDPYELYRNPSVVEYEVLDNERSHDLLTAVGEAQWVAII